MSQAAVLIIEDDHDLRELLAMALEDDGYHVLSVVTGGEGVQVAVDHKLDLVVTDVRLPDMDGITALQKISVYQPALRSIVMTGYTSKDAPLRALDLLAVDYLYKPFPVKALLKAVERALLREEERTSVLGSLLGGVKKLVDKVAEANQARALQALEPLRERALRTWYVAVRSKQLDERAAHLVWEQLEMAEHHRRQARPTVDLAACYKYVEDLTKAFCRKHAPTCNRPAEQLPKPLWERFFQAIMSGNVACHHLATAAYVRSLTPFELSQAPELTGMRERFWG